MEIRQSSLYVGQRGIKSAARLVPSHPLRAHYDRYFPGSGLEWGCGRSAPALLLWSFSGTGRTWLNPVTKPPLVEGLEECLVRRAMIFPRSGKLLTQRFRHALKEPGSQRSSCMREVFSARRSALQLRLSSRCYVGQIGG